MLKIAVVYICTGRYRIFWKDFYNTSEKLFFSGNEKHYFIFTDDDQIKNDRNITVVFRSARGFPLDSLMRFEMFLKIEKELRQFDYVFFFNSNMIFVEQIGTDILPVGPQFELAGVIHPGYYGTSPVWYPYERNKKSFAYIRYKKREFVYYMGSLFGGTSKAFIELCECCDKWTKSDLSNGLMPVYHDESYLNRYFSERVVYQLNPGYSYPEGWKIPFVPKIVLKDKVSHGGKYFNKLADQNLMTRIKNRSIRLAEGFLWYINR